MVSVIMVTVVSVVLCEGEGGLSELGVARSVERERGSLHFETGGSSSPVQPAQTHCTPPASQSQGKTTKWLPNLGLTRDHVCPCSGLCKIWVVVEKLDRKNVQFHAIPATD